MLKNGKKGEIMSSEKYKKNLLIYQEYLDINKTKKNPVNFGEFLYGIGNEYTGLIFWEQEKDSLGNSGGNPTWGYLYEYFGEEENEEDKLIGIGDVIYKEYDYDYPNNAYNEKIYSVLAQKVVKNCRVPHIDVAFLPNSKQPTTISHCIFDTSKEEMFEIKDFLYNIFERNELKTNQDIVLIEDLLNSIKMSVSNEQDYKEIEEGVVQVLALDAITNNPDRHPNNWAVVRNIQTGKYSLGMFDNSIAFYNMIQKRNNNMQWVSSYVLTQERVRNGIGDNGEKVINYLKEHYTDYFNKFLYNFMDKLPEFFNEIEEYSKDIDVKYLKKCIEEKLRCIQKLYKGRENDDGESR